MRDDLIGFLLGALDAAEQEELRRRLAEDESLQAELKLAERSLIPLQWAEPSCEPPAGLAERTYARMERLCWARAESLDPELAAEGLRAFSVADENLAAAPLVGWKNADPNVSDPPVLAGRAAQQRAAFPSERVVREAGMSPREWTLADFVVAAGVCLAVSCLFFPAIANSRYHSQLAGCQNHMRELGQAFADYSGGPGGYYPVIPASGPASVAGIYGPKLVERGLVDDGRVFLCPGKGSTLVLRIPLPSEIASAEGPQLVRLHRTMGGDYAYALGYLRNGRLEGMRNQGLARGALLADAPLEQTRNFAIGTHGRGQNVLFEDGHVEFVTSRYRPGTKDDLFVNAQGLELAGVDANDYVLAPSHVSPLP